MTVTSRLNPISLNNASFGTTGNITIKDDTSFSSTINDWKLYLKGDVDNINVTATLTYTSLPTVIDTKNIDMRYSPYNLTSAYETLNFIPSSLSAKNVQPYGQSTTTPYWNITAISTHHDTVFYINTYESLPVCAVLTASTTYTGAQTSLSGCTSGFPIDVVINSLCDGCVQTVDYDSWSGVATG
jgi:hypothetical protein